jgi:hypothetical protein
MITFKTYTTEASKVGDLVKITSKDLVYEYEKTSDRDFFSDAFDPQGGGGGWDPFESTIAAKEASAWVKKNDSRIGTTIDYFLPKSPGLQKLKLYAPPFSNKYKYGVDDNFPVVGKVRPTERYKFIVDTQTYKALPDDTIASSQYDYSFHAGEGIVTSWIMAIGADQAEVKSKLDAALKKVKVEYVGSETELKYAQKRAVGR